MSRTPAASLARLKASYAVWQISRHPDGGFIAGHPSTGARVSAPTTDRLEIMIQTWEPPAAEIPASPPG